MAPSRIPILIIIAAVVTICLIALFIYIIVLLIKALKKYLNSTEIRKENATIRISLGETIKHHRVRCGMTQEFVADSLSVSRQAVSKWETGRTDPSTANLLSLAKLFDISPEELLKDIK